MSAPTYQRLESDLPSDTDGLLLHTFTSNHSRRYETPSPAPTESATGPDVDEEVSTVSHIKDVRQTAFPAESTGNNVQSVMTVHHESGPDYQEKKVKHNKSFIKLLLPGTVRWVISLLLMVGFYLAIWSYQERVISAATKSIFDAIIVGISIALSLNIASSLKAVALDLRWWVLSIKRRASKEVDLILHCDSMTDLLRLVFVAPRPRTAMASLLWICLNIAAQVGIAVVSLTYSADPGPEDIYRAPSISNVSIADMNSFTSTLGRFQSSRDDSFAAHVLGDVGSSYNFSMLPNEPLTNAPWASYPAAFWNATDHWEYVFLESAPGFSSPNFLSIYTDRVVISSGVCKTPPWRYNISDNVAILTVDGSNDTVIFPSIAFGLEMVYYLTSPISYEDANGSAGNGSCGPGCSNIKVIEVVTGPPAAGSVVSNDGPYYYYDCNITVVSAAPDQTLSPRNGAIAAQAIALSGQIHAELTGQSHGGTNDYVAYAIDVPFGEPQNNSATGMASLISRFAIGVVAAAAQTNPPLTVAGAEPMQGVRLKLSFPVTFYIMLGLIGGLQLILVMVTAILLRGLEIPEEILLSHEGEIRKRFVR